MDYNKLIEQLRSTQSRSKREMLDSAADAIESLLSDLELAQSELEQGRERY